MPRMTLQTQLVLEVLLREPDRQRYGLELSDLVGVATGTIYPILARLEQAGWLVSEWEVPTSYDSVGRPPRRLYRITADGAAAAVAALARSRARHKRTWILGVEGA